ncbi:hypothetical protein [Chengkuizengella axinellae]|uniref:Uncharacterized protein n=1 Tax=Chengkuizengella axinellae TaxID=3064388 RepID=A0ABT9J3A6_9BACL|nr:hypothetical protein [Chengkuizengella sp. 2205SS18-9]MDP5276048.1 hypothetical protein [Chengkuizengella sp. 2205SS18-9]
MNKTLSPLDEIDMIGKLADLKEEHYKNTLLINSMMELLLEKDILSYDEIILKMKQLDEEEQHPQRI